MSGPISPQFSVARRDLTRFLPMQENVDHSITLSNTICRPCGVLEICRTGKGGYVLLIEHYTLLNEQMAGKNKSVGKAI